jgi:hypothetical protein
MNVRYRRIIQATGGIFVLGLALLAIDGALLARQLFAARAATTHVQASAQQRDLLQTCQTIGPAAQAWDRAGTLSRPLAPALHHLGWVPRVGRDLRLLPELIQLARHGARIGVRGCQLVTPALAATTQAERLATIARALQADPQQVVALRADVQQMQVAYTEIAPLLADSVYLAPYRDQLHQLGAALPTLTTVVEADQDGAALAWLLGLDAPRRFLIVLQNPFELRPTGGFIGLVCVLHIAQAAPTVERCAPSETFAAAAPADWPTPFAYTHYLRLGRYTLRDANWSPDFPATADVVRQFWALNEQPAVDGVIAVDPYMLAPLLRAIGPIALAGEPPIAADQAVDAIMARYYDGQLFRDKASLSQLFTTILQRTLQAEPAKLPQIASAIRTSLDERHLLIDLDQPALSALLARTGWDGAVGTDQANALRIVDADVGYGAVNAFIERLTQVDLLLDPSGAPLTATLTLTYTNSYSPWAEAATPYAVYGQCLDPDSGQLMRQPGCYGNYVRVYAPQASQLIEISGIDQPLGTDQDGGRQVFGGYLRLEPGDQRTVRLSYRLPSLQPGPLTIEKQPGTLAPPTLVTVTQGERRAATYLELRTDRTIDVRALESAATLDSAQQRAAAAFERQAALAAGRVEWEQGRRAAAIQRWQTGGALDGAINDARTLPANRALTLLAALAAVDPSGHAAFEQATLLAAGGDLPAAQPLYQRAATQGQANPLALLSWAEQQAAAGAALPALRDLPATSSAVRRWRMAVDELEQIGAFASAANRLAVLRQLQPNDRALALRYADLLLRLERREQAAAAYAALAGDDIYGRVAAARQAQIAEDREGALAHYKAALPLATTYETAFRIADGLRDLGDQAGALAAYERTAQLAPGSIWPLMAAGNLLRQSDAAAAKAWYERAQQRSPASGYPDFALGTLLLDAGDIAAARPLLETAAAKQPDVHAFQDMVARVSGGTPPAAPQTRP